VVFAPKELKVAQDLSARLGDYTYAGRSLSRPSGLSSGRRSQTDSDQRRALMLPQELTQMPPDQLILLRAGLPPVRGRKIVYWRECAFTRRLQPPPQLPPRPLPAPQAASIFAKKAGGADRPRTRTDDDLTLTLPDLEAAGIAPLPDAGATPEEVEAWVNRFLDSSAQRTPETAHGR
jgi:type IV secretion system protein VirD4